MPKGHISANVELYKLIAQRMVLEAGVELYTNAVLSHCDCSDGQVQHIYLESKNGTEALSARCFIDATGDADLCHMAQMPMQEA